MSCTCKECDQKFDSERGLHAHLRAHKMSMGEYYQKHYPRHNLLTGELRKFKDKDDYFENDFENKEQMLKWLDITPKERARGYAYGMLLKRIEDKSLSYGPSSLELQTLSMPDVRHFKKLFGTYTEACKWCKVEPLFPFGFAGDFFKIKDIEIMVDTREQKPWVYNKTITNKLHIGDYTATGKYFSNIFIDRKSAADFVGTMSPSNIDRFRREIQTAVEHDAYVVVVVETSLAKLKKEAMMRHFYGKLPLVFHNMRAIQHEFPRRVQFVFAGSRSSAALVAQAILYHGEKIKNVDIQYLIDHVG